MEKAIVFKAYVCLTSELLFSEKIMIFKPNKCIERTYVSGRDFTQETKVSTLVELFKPVLVGNDSFGEWAIDNLCFQTVYVETENVLLGLREDKLLWDMFEYFKSSELRLAYIYVPGGASFHCEGYRFEVRPNEDIHKHTPHVHVVRGEENTRYSLDTLSRFPKDTFSKTFQRDEKKVILPYLREHREILYAYWNHYINGYELPAEDELGRQYYKES